MANWNDLLDCIAQSAKLHWLFLTIISLYLLLSACCFYFSHCWDLESWLDRQVHLAERFVFWGSVRGQWRSDALGQSLVLLSGNLFTFETCITLHQFSSTCPSLTESWAKPIGRNQGNEMQRRTFPFLQRLRTSTDMACTFGQMAVSTRANGCLWQQLCQVCRG